MSITKLRVWTLLHRSGQSVRMLSNGLSSCTTPPVFGALFSWACKSFGADLALQFPDLILVLCCDGLGVVEYDCFPLLGVTLMIRPASIGARSASWCLKCKDGVALDRTGGGRRLLFKAGNWPSPVSDRSAFAREVLGYDHLHRSKATYLNWLYFATSMTKTSSPPCSSPNRKIESSREATVLGET